MLESVYITSNIRSAGLFLQAVMPWRRITEKEFCWVNERIRVVNKMESIRGLVIDIAYIDYSGLSQLSYNERFEIETHLSRVGSKIIDINKLVESAKNGKIRGYNHSAVYFDDFNENNY
jgi:hypothetical protein